MALRSGGSNKQKAMSVINVLSFIKTRAQKYSHSLGCFVRRREVIITSLVPQSFMSYQDF
jgi:hypothetical protein